MAEYVTFVCPHCGKGMQLAREHLGRAGRCAHCGEGISTPSEAEVAALGGEEPADAVQRPADHFSLSLDERLDRFLTPPYLIMGIIFPLIILAYCGWFGVIRQDIWFGGVAYGGEAYGGMVTGRPARIMGIGGVTVAAGFHLNMCWAVLMGSKILNGIGNALVIIGLIVFLGSLLVPAAP
jgi:hypothetical protein